MRGVPAALGGRKGLRLQGIRGAEKIREIFADEGKGEEYEAD